MNARRSPGSSSVQSVRWLASDPPVVSETFSGAASGYHAAMLARASCDPSESGYPRAVWRNASASAFGPSRSRIVIGVTPDSDRSYSTRCQ